MLPRSEMIHRMHILPRRFLIVTGLAQGTPVLTIPKELFISTVRHDVIHDSRLRVSSTCPAFLTQGMHPKERLALPLPPAPVPTAARRPYRLRVQGFMRLTVSRPRSHQSSTARMLTGYSWFHWHMLTSLHISSLPSTSVSSTHRFFSTLRALNINFQNSILLTFISFVAVCSRFFRYARIKKLKNKKYGFYCLHTATDDIVTASKPLVYWL